MTFSLIHLSDPHFGRDANLGQLDAIEQLVPDLEPRLIVVAGDLTQRARHGEFQAARAWMRELGRTAPVAVIPGNHDVQWWWRPLLPFGSGAKYGKYRRYFGPVLSPHLALPEAVVVGTLTSHGVAWGSLTPRLRDLAVKGHLPKKEVERARQLFERATDEQVRILLLHHNVLRGELSRRMGLARWKQAQRRIVASGADVVLCGHDHQEQVDTLGDRVVVCAAGTLCRRSRGGRPSSFYRVVVGEEAIQVEVYQWEAERHIFRRTDVHMFGRAARGEPATPVEARVG